MSRHQVPGTSRWKVVRRAGALAAAALAALLALNAGAAVAKPPSGSGQPDFGPNVTIFDPSMPTSQIQATVDAISAQQVDNEMGTAAVRAAVQAGHLRHREPAR